MKKLLIGLFIALGMVLPIASTAAPVSAINILDPTGTTGPCSGSNTAKPELCKDNKTNTNDNPIFGPNGILTALINILSLIVGIVSVIIIVTSGLRLILAGGDPSAAATARRSVTYALAGLVVALVSQAIVALVLSKL